MKRWMVLALVAIFVCGGLSKDLFAQKFKDILEQVLVSSAPQRGGGSSQYSFAPGEPVIRQASYEVYFSGSEMGTGGRTLLLTLFEGNRAVPLKFPNPTVIRVRDYRLTVISFDNESLRVQLMGSE